MAPGANRVGILAHHREVARAPGESGATPVATADQPSRRHLVAATNPPRGRRHADVRLFTEPDVGRHVVARACGGRRGKARGGDFFGLGPLCHLTGGRSYEYPPMRQTAAMDLLGEFFAEFRGEVWGESEHCEDSGLLPAHMWWSARFSGSFFAKNREEVWCFG